MAIAMRLKSIRYLFLAALCGLLIGACDNDDEPMSQEAFKAFVSGKYFRAIKDGGGWLQKSGDELHERPDAVIDGTGPIMNSTFWFTDENTLLTSAVLDESAIMPSSLDFQWREYLYKKGEEIILFVRSNYRYDASTGRFSTDNQSLIREKRGSAYYIERISDKDFTMRIEFKEPMLDDIAGYRITCKEYLLPGLHPEFPAYKVFDSNDEAIAYVKSLLETDR